MICRWQGSSLESFACIGAWVDWIDRLEDGSIMLSLFRAEDARKQARRADMISGYQGSRRQKKRIARDGLFSGYIMILPLPERQTYGQETPTLEDTYTQDKRHSRDIDTNTHKQTQKRERHGSRLLQMALCS